MNEKLKNAWDWMKAHKKGIAIGAGVTASVIIIAVLLKKCADADVDADQIQDILDKEVLTKNEVIEAWKENGGEALSDQVLEKLKDLHEFAKEHDFVLNGMFGFGPDTEFDKEFCDFEIWNNDVMVEYFSNDV